MCIYTYMYEYIYIHTYRERGKRGRETETERGERGERERLRPQRPGFGLSLFFFFPLNMFTMLGPQPVVLQTGSFSLSALWKFSLSQRSVLLVFFRCFSRQPR